MTCIDIPVFLGYVFSLAVILGFPFIYLSARKFGRAFEEHDGLKEAGTAFGLRALASIAVAAILLYAFGFVPTTPC